MPTHSRYIDPLTDFGFKRIFGSDPNKDLLIAFLNAVFNGRKTIVDLVYNKNEHPGEVATEGAVIFDILCTDQNGDRFIIEVQRAQQRYFKERAVFYMSRLISEQAPKGDRKAWNYQISEVYLIAILEDIILPGNTDSEYLYDICLCNRDSGAVFYDRLGFIFIELRNFTRLESELFTDLDRWMFVLKHISKLEKMPLYLRKPIFEKLFNIAEYSNLSKEDKMLYDNSLKQKWDNQNMLDYAIEEAVKAAEERAEQKALSDKYEMIPELEKAGLSMVQIAGIVKLSLAEVEQHLSK